MFVNVLGASFTQRQGSRPAAAGYGGSSVAWQPPKDFGVDRLLPGTSHDDAGLSAVRLNPLWNRALCKIPRWVVPESRLPAV